MKRLVYSVVALVLCASGAASAQKASLPIAVSAKPEEFQAFVDEEVKKWSRVIHDNGTKMAP